MDQPSPYEVAGWDKLQMDAEAGLQKRRPGNASAKSLSDGKVQQSGTGETTRMQEKENLKLHQEGARGSQNARGAKGGSGRSQGLSGVGGHGSEGNLIDQRLSSNAAEMRTSAEATAAEGAPKVRALSEFESQWRNRSNTQQPSDREHGCRFIKRYRSAR